MVLEAASLRVRSGDGEELLSGVDLSVAAGETLLVCGRPGSGKTLLAKALKGVLGEHDGLAVSGTVRRDGPVGFVFQNPGTQIVRRTGRRDVAFGLENRGVPPEEIEARIDRHAALLDAEGLLDREVRALSRGETAKVALLGVLVTEPAVVVLDEPLASLDRPNTRLVLEAIDRLRREGTAVVIAEHDARDLLARGDRVVLLRDGAVAAEGPPRSIAADLQESGVRLPFATELALELGESGTAVPLSDEGDRVA